jgi:hypothetical protein
MTRNENQMYSNISSIAKSLEKIANALETNVLTTPKPKDIPGFEGTLDALDVLTDIKTITDDYASNKDEYETDGTSVGNGKYEDDSYAYETDLQGIRVDSDHDIRTTAQYYNDEIHPASNIKTKKDAILDYVTNEFGLHGARYTDIIKFAYYLNGPNKLKYTSEDRGYYACAFATRYGGHLIQGGKDQLVKGINNEGKERYFALSSVDNFTGFYKRIA